MTLTPPEESISCVFQVSDRGRRRYRHKSLVGDEPLTQLLDNVHDIVWLFSVHDAKLIFRNLAFERITGRKRKGVLEEPPPFIQAIHPQDRERVVPVLEKRIERGIAKEVSLALS